MNQHHCPVCLSTAFLAAELRPASLCSNCGREATQSGPCRSCSGELFDDGAVHVMRCARCNVRPELPVSLATHGPFVGLWRTKLEGPHRRFDSVDSALSVAWMLTRAEPVLVLEELDCRGRVADQNAPRGLACSSQVLSDRHSRELIPYELHLDCEVHDATSLGEVLDLMVLLAKTVRFAIAAGDSFDPTEVHDAAYCVFDYCRDCDAWPGERHTRDECGLDVFGERRKFWGRWRHERDAARCATFRLARDAHDRIVEAIESGDIEWATARLVSVEEMVRERREAALTAEDEQSQLMLYAEEAA
jgi:hypothetical protein